MATIIKGGDYEFQAKIRIKGSKQDNYRLNAWLKHPLAARSLASLKSSDYADHARDRLSAGISSGTIHRNLMVIATVFAVARDEWDLPIEESI